MFKLKYILSQNNELPGTSNHLKAYDALQGKKLIFFFQFLLRTLKFY